jgi:hypothetical protein
MASSVVRRLKQAGNGFAVLLLVAGCESYVFEEPEIDRSPVLPPVEVVVVADGFGTLDVNLAMTRAEVEATLGPPVAVEAMACRYADQDIMYRVYYASDQVSRIEVACTRFCTLMHDAALGDVPGVGYDFTRAQMVARYGEPSGDINAVWYYDSRGVAFPYDPSVLDVNHRRVKGVWVRPPR